MLKKTKAKGNGKVKVTFVQPADNPHLPASVVGDFNNWDPTANKLQKRSNQTYSTSVVLEKDQQFVFRYYSKDGIWFNDEAADAYSPNEYGSENGIVIT